MTSQWCSCTSRTGSSCRPGSCSALETAPGCFDESRSASASPDEIRICVHAGARVAQARAGGGHCLGRCKWLGWLSRVASGSPYLRPAVRQTYASDGNCRARSRLTAAPAAPRARAGRVATLRTRRQVICPSKSGRRSDRPFIPQIGLETAALATGALSRRHESLFRRLGKSRRACRCATNGPPQLTSSALRAEGARQRTRPGLFRDRCTGLYRHPVWCHACPSLWTRLEADGPSRAVQLPT